MIRVIVQQDSSPGPESKSPTLAIFGTASDVGKSLITAGLCRILSDAGVKVAPFKAQNMSNNSGVTLLGGEMGRAQIVQARAARVEPHVDMNPVLLKPSSENGSQVILLGKVVGQRDAQAYFSGLSPLREAAYDALTRLRSKYECIVIEGAGSCAEVNLRAREYVNFPCAHFAESQVILVADIDRGGVFAQVVGSLEVMLPEDRARVRGIIINRFRGDRALFDDGVQYLEERTGLPVVGVVPYLMGLSIESEDSLQMQSLVDPPLELDKVQKQESEFERVFIAVLRLPHISNSTDFDALQGLDGVELHFLYRPRDLDAYDLVLLPGSKNVRHDLSWLKQVGWINKLETFEKGGGRMGGICGGYQMMGKTLADPEGLEGPPGESEGLGVLPTSTTMMSTKVLKRVSGTCLHNQANVSGYEIHVGETTKLNASSDRENQQSLTWAILKDDRSGELQSDGCVIEQGRIWGTYLHGLFDSPEFLIALLSELRPARSAHWHAVVRRPTLEQEHQLDSFADLLRKHLDIDKIFDWLEMPSPEKAPAISLSGPAKGKSMVERAESVPK